MANKDYVRRGGRSATKKPAKKTIKKHKPWRSGLLALLLAGGFGYGLYLLNSDPEPAPAPQHSEPVAVQKPKPQKALPPPPKEKWDYMKSLPKRQVEVVAKELKISKVPYVLQCGAYKKKSQAESRKVAIAFQGLKSRVIKKPGSSWYRVILGPFTFRRDAEKNRHILRRVKIEPCAIWKENL